ncbi:MAG: BON domain-containing protein [Pseudomonadota bacterium]
MNTPRICFVLLTASALIMTASCGPVVVGTAAVGTYKGATDQRSVGNFIDDSVIATKVKTDLIASQLVTSRHVDVMVLQGVVYLTGVVESDTEYRMAESISANIDGVREVKNQLVVGEVTIGQKLDDALMTSRINTNLMIEPGIHSLNIAVDVNKGIISLTGIIDSEETRQKVLTLVRETSGSTSIVDNLKVLK